MASDRNVLGGGMAAIGAFCLLFAAALSGDTAGPFPGVLVVGALVILALVVLGHEDLTVVRTTRIPWVVAFLLGGLTFVGFAQAAIRAPAFWDVLGGGSWFALFGSGLVVAGAWIALLAGQEAVTGEDYTASGDRRRLVLGSGAAIGATLLGLSGYVVYDSIRVTIPVDNNDDVERSVRVSVSGTYRDSERTFALGPGEVDEFPVFPAGREYTLTAELENGSRDRTDIPRGDLYGAPSISIHGGSVLVTYSAV